MGRKKYAAAALPAVTISRNSQLSADAPELSSTSMAMCGTADAAEAEFAEGIAGEGSRLAEFDVVIRSEEEAEEFEALEEEEDEALEALGALGGPDDLAEDEVERGRVRFWATREQMFALARHGAAVCAAGRPLCQFCGNPIDPDGHVCVAMNGHRGFGEA